MTCNQFNPAVHNPEKFQSVDQPGEVSNYLPQKFYYVVN